MDEEENNPAQAYTGQAPGEDRPDGPAANPEEPRAEAPEALPDSGPPESPPASGEPEGPAEVRFDPEQVSDDDVIVSIDPDGDEFYVILDEVGVGKRRSPVLPVLLIILLLLAAVGAALAWHLTRDKNGPATSGTENPPEAVKEKTHEQIVVERTPEALRRRRESLRLKTAKKYGGSEETEKCVRSALGFLAKAAREDGSQDSRKHGSHQNVDLAMTGLSLLAFIGAGQTAQEGDFRETVNKAASFVVASQDPKTGRIWQDGQGGNGVGYTHAVCGLALAELAALDKDPEISEAARKAVDYSVKEHPYIKGGKPFGWRYNARQYPDSSVTGWFVMQLKAAPEAGIEVPREAMTGAAAFLEGARSGEKAKETGEHLHLYGYENAASRTARRSAIGCLCRLYIDVSPGELLGTLDWITKAKPPKWEEQDWYYWYYAMMVTFQVDQERFRAWNDALRDRIVENQVKDGEFAGSWAAGGDYKSWGRLFSTTFAALCLEVYYRYAPKEDKDLEGVK